MEKKLRIQLFDEEGRLVNDRLVSQDTELYKGPLETHQGIFRIELTLMGLYDVDKAKSYLDKLVGNLPLETIKVKKSKTTLDTPDQRETLIEGLLNLDDTWDQDRLIKYLRDEGFVFRTIEFLRLLPAFDDFQPKDRHENYQWMVKELKVAKNPTADKYDPFLIIGIILDGERTDKIQIYLNNAYHKSIKVLIPEKPTEVFKKTGMLKFPPFMEEDEKKKFMIELRALENNSEKKPSKFFTRWAKHVKNLPSKITVNQ